MIGKRGYFGKILRISLDAAADIIDGAVEKGKEMGSAAATCKVGGNTSHETKYDSTKKPSNSKDVEALAELGECGSLERLLTKNLRKPNAKCWGNEHMEGKSTRALFP